MSEEFVPIERGSYARVTKTHTLVEGWKELREGDVFEVEEFYDADPGAGEDMISEAHYEGNANGGWSNVLADARYVELQMTPEQARNREVPTAQAITRQLMVLDSYYGFEVNASDAPYEISEGVWAVDAYGETDEGLTFGFTVTVSNVEETDF